MRGRVRFRPVSAPAGQRSGHVERQASRLGAAEAGKVGQNPLHKVDICRAEADPVAGHGDQKAGPGVAA